MNFDYREHIPAAFDQRSKVWVYQANRLFTISEAFEIEEILTNFLSQWNSHGTPVKGYANLFFGQFIVFMADETATGVSGCSTDSSVRVIKEMERRFKVDMFDRQLLAFLIKDKIQVLPLSQFSYAVSNGFIDGETIYFNNLVKNKQELLNDWMVPVKNSWLKTKMGSVHTAGK